MLDVTVTRSQATIKHRCEYAVTVFHVEGIPEDEVTRILNVLARSKEIFDYYWQPSKDVKYVYEGYYWQVTEIIVPISKKASKKAKYVPIVYLKLIGGAIDVD